LHFFVVGLHDPEHAPPLQTFVHAVSLCHAPVELHCSGVRPLQVRESGEQTPEHAAETHAWSVQSEGELQRPLVLQV
jgi:hypothetical protein